MPLAGITFRITLSCRLLKERLGLGKVFIRSSIIQMVSNPTGSEDLGILKEIDSIHLIN